VKEIEKVWERENILRLGILSNYVEDSEEIKEFRKRYIDYVRGHFGGQAKLNSIINEAISKACGGEK